MTKTYTLEAECSTCRKKFRWERASPFGRARKYCDECDPKRRRAIRVVSKVEGHK